LTVTPLEDRCVATVLPVSPVVNPPATSVSLAPQVFLFTPPPAWQLPLATGDVGIMGVRVNRNETFVRRRKAHSP
jgi:hypothetical protein